MTNHRLARLLMPESGCNSILGPDEDIRFSDAAILWAALYHVMFSEDATAIKRAVLSAKAQEVATMFRVKLNYIARDDDASRGYTLTSLLPEGEGRPNKRMQLTRSAMARRRGPRS